PHLGRLFHSRVAVVGLFRCRAGAGLAGVQEEAVAFGAGDWVGDAYYDGLGFLIKRACVAKRTAGSICLSADRTVRRHHFRLTISGTSIALHPFGNILLGPAV